MAIVILFGVFISLILAILFSFGVYFMGYISCDLFKLGEIIKNVNIEILIKYFYLVLFNLERFNLKNEVVYGILFVSGEFWVNFFYGIFYIVLMLILVNLIFVCR